MGVSLKRLQGWEPRRFTEYVYGEDGRLIRSVETVEAEWDDEQLALILAHLEIENDVGPHGQPMSEATDRLGDAKNPDGRWWYKATAPHIDYAQKALDEARETYRKTLGKDESVPSWIHFGVTRVERPKRD